MTRNGAIGGTAPRPSVSGPSVAAPRARVTGSSLRLFTVGGVDVAIHVSWIVIAALVTWSLATGYFPTADPEAGTVGNWILGAIAALLFFASVLAHELAHSWVAKSRGLDVESITLFIFGGVSNLSGEAKDAGTEFAIAIVGPLTSFAVAVVAYLVAVAFHPIAGVAATAGYLAFVNAALGVFNLVPGFPLDGGRVLRSIVWGITHDVRRATEVASAVGRAFAWLLMLWGLWQILTGDFLSGVWIGAIGWFLHSASVFSLEQTVLETRLGRLRVGDVIRAETAAVSPATPIPELIDRFMLPGARRAVPVVDEAGRLAGIVTLSDVTRIPPERRRAYAVRDAMTPADRLVTVAPTTSLRDAISALGSGDFEQVPVVDAGRPIALLTRADVMRELQIRDALRISPEVPPDRPNAG